jgi:4-hydroxy-tetrahydrodipicolinate synthase
MNSAILWRLVPRKDRSAMTNRDPALSATQPLSGCVPVLCTPFHDDGTCDLTSLQREVDWLIGEGANGLACLAVTGEGYTLTESEREAVITTVVDTVNRRRPVIVSIDSQSDIMAAERARRARTLGADAVMATPPFFIKPDLAGIIGYYAAIGETGLPVILQDIPQVTGLTTGPDVWNAVAEAVPALVALKLEAMPQGPAITAAREIVNGRLRVFSGWGGLGVLDALDRGADGTMPAPNFTRLFADIHHLWETGSREEAAVRFSATLPFLLWSMQSIGHSVTAAKEELVRIGIIATATRRAPAVALDEVARFQLQHYIVARHG